jgi:hypothetical protein
VKFYIVRKTKLGKVEAVFKYRLHAELYAYNYGFYLEKEPKPVDVIYNDNQEIDADKIIRRK